MMYEIYENKDLLGAYDEVKASMLIKCKTEYIREAAKYGYKIKNRYEIKVSHLTEDEADILNKTIFEKKEEKEREREKDKASLWKRTLISSSGRTFNLPTFNMFNRVGGGD